MKKTVTAIVATFVGLVVLIGGIGMSASASPISNVCVTALCASVPTLTVTLPAPARSTVTVRPPAKTVAGPTITRTVPGPTRYLYGPTVYKTVYVPGPTVTRTQTVATGQTTSTPVTMVSSPKATKTITVPKMTKELVIKKGNDVVRYIRLTKTQAFGISAFLVALGAIVSLICLWIVYRIGQSEGREAGARSSLLEFKRIMNGKKTE